MAIRKKELFDPGTFSGLQKKGSSAVPIFREALKTGRQRLEQYYQAGARPDDLVQNHAWLVDQLVLSALEHHRDLLPGGRDISLIAVGGYGRGELHPASDIDLMILLHKPVRNELNEFLETFVRFLWDIGMEIGHSVRTLKECVRESRKNITVATNLMEARLLAGDENSFTRMKQATGPAKLWPSRKFFAAKWEEQIGRHRRFDDTAYNLEPNIKEGPGGLRDIQMISWVTQRQFGTNSLHELVEHGFLTEEEYRALIRGRNYLWQVRNGLHYLAGRREDRLLFDHQRVLAAKAGFEDKAGSLAVEQYMKRYYRTIKELSLLNEILLQHFQEAILAKSQGRSRSLNRRFRTHGDFIETTDDRIFEYAPWAMLEMFLLLQQHPELKGIRASTIRQLRTHLGLINKNFRKDLACRSLFMEILRQPSGITHELRRMNAYGVLGAYLPAFGRIVGQMQHDLFHVYTVDEHILFVLRNVRRFTVPEFSTEFPMASSIIKNLVKPERLYVAALYHDIAKGRGGDHSVLGEKETKRFCSMHALGEYDTRFICWLVRNHLIMSMVAQRQDIHDADVIMNFSRIVGDQVHLDNLYLLTVADMRGTSPTVWNDWKRGLLGHLYQETSRLIRHGFGSPIDMKQHLSEIRSETLEQLAARSIPLDRVEKFWQEMENEYFLRHRIDSLCWHATIITSSTATDLPLVATTYNPRVGGTEVMIYTLDREGLFSIITGALEKRGLSVVDARMHAARNGYIIDTFVVLNHENNAVTNDNELRLLDIELRDELIQAQGVKKRGDVLLTRQLKHFPVKTSVSFAQSANGRHTIIEVVAQDRPGLLHQIALALRVCHVRLVGAKIATYGERAEDIFFVTTPEGELITKSAQLKKINEEISQRLDSGPSA
ncbi:MAG: [protein-PII] uridylyltransferase [Acidiferrobacterales bacterium]